MPTRRTALGYLAAWTGAMAAGLACRSNETRPGACPALAGRRIRWIVPNAAGGGYDTESRMLQPFLEERLATTIVVDNQPGAGGIIGASSIADALPDGHTLGMISAPGLTVARLLGQERAPNPANDFTVLGRVSRSLHVWAVRAGGPLQTLADVLTASRDRSIVFPLNEVASVDFIGINATAALLGIPVDVVPGFEGTRAAVLGTLRGDVDLMCSNLDPIRPFIASGELRPILQISAEPIRGGSMFDDVPLLGGPTGEAARRAPAIGREPGWAIETAASLARVIGSGRLVVGPPGMPPTLAGCLSGVLAGVLESDGVRRIAGESLDPGSAEAARADVQAIPADAARILPLVKPALEALRG